MVKTLVPNHKFLMLQTEVDLWRLFVYMLVIAASYMALSVFVPLRDVNYPELLHKRAIFSRLCWTHTDDLEKHSLAQACARESEVD